MVIDIRGNGGGFYATSEKVASRFIREGPIRECAPRQGAMKMTVADGSAWGRTVPISILVNERTGSGAEEVASSLRENGVANLVGRHTAGTFAGARPFPLQDGSSLIVALEVCHSGKGQEIEHVGLDPDLPVDLDVVALADGRDTQLEAALGYLRTKIAP